MSPRKKQTQYVFTDLLTLKESEQAVKGVHIIAVVKFFREPIKTRGTSYSMTIGLTDPSLNGGKFICSLFGDGVERLPTIRAPGDVLILHRLVVEQFCGEMRGSGLPGRGFSWGLISGAPDVPLEVESDWDHFNVTEADLAKVEALLTWYRSPTCPVEREADTQARTPAATCTVANLGEKTFCDLAGQLLAKTRLASSPQSLLLRLWDGTAPCRILRHMDFQSEEVTEVEEIDSPEARWLSRSRFVDVAVFDEHVASCSDLRPGCLVLLTNLRVTASKGDPESPPQLWLQGGGQRFQRGVRQLGDENRAAVELRNRLQMLPQFLRVTQLREKAAPRSLKQVIDHTEKATDFKCCLRAPVRSVTPLLPHKMLRTFCATCECLQPENTQPTAEPEPCHNCGAPTELAILLQVVFQSAAGAIRAHIWREQALYFLSQFISRPADLLTEPERGRAVTGSLRSLPGLEMDAVIVTYLPAAAKGDRTLLQVQIWDTQLTKE